jgi:hypothetical protein
MPGSDRAERCVEALRRNPYPGRGLVVGRAADGRALIQVYWIMGRSDNSRNRILVRDGTGVRTAPFDPSRMRDPALVIYRAMGATADGTHHVVSNGDQTDTVLEALEGGHTFEEALQRRTFEPDAPHYTPRIAAIARAADTGAYTLAILKAPGNDPELTARQFFTCSRPRPGAGHGLTTYAGDGDPLPPFEGEPMDLPIPDRPLPAVAAFFWDLLDQGNRVALAAKRVDLETGSSEVHIVNRHGGAPASGGDR